MAVDNESLEGAIALETLDPLHDDLDDTNDVTVKAIPNPSVIRLLGATCSTAGLQLVWSTIFSNGSPYLFSLGVSSSSSALIWAAAPICGAFFQPFVASLSDRSHSSYGKRRPFILAGTVLTITGMGVLAWCENIHEMLSALFGFSRSTTSLTIIVIISVWLLNMAIQPLQFGIRALIVDVFPEKHQVEVSAYASRSMSFGNILGYLLGSIPMFWLSDPDTRSRFRFLCSVTSVALAVTTWVTCSTLREADATQMETTEKGGFRQIMTSLKHAPPGAIKVCWVQFWAWFGWFGYLYYSSSFIGELYRKVHPNVTDSDLNSRIGSGANLMFAITSFITTIAAPFLLRFNTKASLDSSDGRRRNAMLSRVWALGHLLFAASMLSLGLTQSVPVGVYLVAVVGIPWAFSLWIPFAIFNSEISAQIQHEEMAWRSGAERLSTASTKECAGTLVALHNTAISTPQILASLMSSLVFWLAEEDGRLGSIVWMMRVSGVSGLWAAYIALR